MIEYDGRRLHSIRGSHRQFVHPATPGRVTMREYLQTSRNGETELMMQYAVVMERVPDSNYCVYVPDPPGCVSTRPTLDEVKRNIQEAIKFHLDGMRAMELLSQSQAPK